MAERRVTSSRARARVASRARGARRGARNARLAPVRMERRKRAILETAKRQTTIEEAGAGAIVRGIQALFSRGAKAAPAAAKASAPKVTKRAPKPAKGQKQTPKKKAAPKPTMTAGERAQEKLAQYGRVTTRGERAQESRAAFGRMRAKTIDSARQVAQGSSRVRGTGPLQKSPSKTPRAIKQGMKPPATEAQKTAAAPWTSRKGKPKTIIGTALVGAAAAYGFGGTGRKSSATSGSGGLSGRSIREAERGTASKAPKGTWTRGASGWAPSFGAKKPSKPAAGSSAASSAASSAGRSSGSSRGPAAAKPKVKVKKTPVPTVSQSRTMWVKKGEMVGGKEVKKGYLAQYGKAEKKVSAKVKIVAPTESGKKAGETWRYKQGKTAARVKRKK